MLCFYQVIYYIIRFTMNQNIDQPQIKGQEQDILIQQTNINTAIVKQIEQSPTKIAFDHKQFGLYADTSLEQSIEVGNNIKLGIDKNETRGSAFMKYIVYHIFGQDKNGPIDTYRRFNQFYKMRVALIKRFPGCFIPSIPDKSISIVDDQIANKRQRYLNDFVRKITKIPHIYNSEQFQALLRSGQKDLSGSFQKWPNPTTSQIINKYKQCFSQLSGKLIDTNTRSSIHQFTKLLQKTNACLIQFKDQLKILASSKDKLNKHISAFFTTNLPSFQTQCLSHCTNNPDDLIITNLNEAKFLEHEKVVSQSSSKNPFWLLYDLMKHEQRDSKAFIQCSKAIEQYQNKKYELQIKLSQNNKTLTQISNNLKKNYSQLKYKLQVQNEAMKKQKQNVQLLTDIIIALVAFIEMDRFKTEKSKYYQNILKKIGGYEISQVQNMFEVWFDWRKKTSQMLSKND